MSNEHQYIRDWIVSAPCPARRRYLTDCMYACHDAAPSCRRVFSILDFFLKLKISSQSSSVEVASRKPEQMKNEVAKLTPPPPYHNSSRNTTQITVNE